MVLQGGWGDGGQMRGVTNISEQFAHQQSIIWIHLKYINTKNPTKCTSNTSYAWGWPSMKLHRCTVEQISEIP